MKYLIDTSALVRVMRRQVPQERRLQVTRGLVAICEPVLCEALAVADTRGYAQAEKDLRDGYPWVPVPDDAWRLISSVRKELAARSSHQGLSVADYLVTATALKLKLTVLHEDADFETVAKTIDGFTEERVSTMP